MKNKLDIIYNVADQLADGIDLDALIDYFRDGQITYMESLTEQELIDFILEYSTYEIEDLKWER